MPRNRRSLSRGMMRLAPFGTFSGLGALAVMDGAYLVAGLLGIGALATGRRLLDRRENRRRELRRQARDNARELARVAREDRVAEPQARRLMGLQDGLLESWELMPEEYRPVLDEDIFTIVSEVEGAARLARRRAALRRYLESANRQDIMRRIEGLEKDLADLEPGSRLRAPLESALYARRGELASCEDVLDGISMINAQLESAESLLGNLRAEMLALDTSLAPGALQPSLVHLKERISYFRHSLDEVTRSIETLPGAERVPAR